MAAQMRSSSFLLLAFAASFSLAPAVAQAGFFESLFGLTPAAPVQAPGAAQPAPAEAGSYRRARRRVEIEPRERRHHEHRTVAAAAPRAPAGPKLQRTTGLMDDRTLRAGDAVMTRDGLRIFTGAEADHHVVADFVPLRAAPYGKTGARRVLVAIDEAAHLDIGRDRRSELQTGRSVSAGVERVPSYTATGATVRYVGP